MAQKAYMQKVSEAEYQKAEEFVNLYPNDIDGRNEYD